MYGCFIRKSTFRKWHITIFFLALVQIIINVFDKFYFIDRKNFIFEMYSKALGEIAIILVPPIKRSKYLGREKNAKEKCLIMKKNCLHYFILVFLYIIYYSLIIGCFLINNDNNSEEKTVLNIIKENLSTKEGIEIILFSLITRFLLKNKYYKHHYLSIIFIIISSVAIDLLLNNYSFLEDKKFIEIFLNILSIISEIVYLCFIQYILYRTYNSNFRKLMFFLGIILLIINTISLLCVITTSKESSLSFVNNFWDYFDNNSIGIIISDFIINLILQFTYSILLILTIHLLGVKFILISHALSKYFFILVNEYDSMKYICIIFFVLQFFFITIYLEILELNFLNLNKDTIRRIISYEPHHHCHHCHHDIIEEKEEDDDVSLDEDRYIIEIKRENKDVNEEEEKESDIELV